MIGRQIGATEKIDKLFCRSSPKEFTKLFYDHCCVLPNHIPRRSLFLFIILHAKWTRALLHFIDDGNGGSLQKVEGYYDRMLMTLKLISSADSRAENCSFNLVSIIIVKKV